MPDAGAARLTSDALAAALAGVPGDALARWLGARRWFGAKGRAVRSARISHVLPLPWAGGPFALAVAEVELDGGERWRYQLPLAARGEGGATGDEGGALPATDQTSWHDATLDEAFRAELLAALARGAVVESSGMRLLFEPVAADAPSLAPRPSSLSSAEQSNSSIVYGDAAILKLFRRLEAGESPEAEIARFLARRGEFHDTPALLGVVRLELAGEGGPASHVAAMCSRFVPNTGDAWSHALARARAYVGAPPKPEPPNLFTAEARELGRVTRALHEALSADEDDPAFAPAFAGDDDVERWLEAARTTMVRAMDELAAAAGALDARAKAPAQALLARRERLLSRLEEIADDAMAQGDAGLLIRHHGDYHLGQVLRTREGGWAIIDFEGEPARPLEERRAKASPLRDVAGMMRSFAYAAATVATEKSGAAVNPAVEVRAARWEREARTAFLAGYLAADEDEPDALLPDSAAGAEALLALFEIEKIFYELSYELNNRPAWAWIPLRGIAKLF